MDDTVTVIANMSVQGLRRGRLYDVPLDDPRLEHWLTAGIVTIQPDDDA